MPKSRAKGPEPRARTFDELLGEHNVTPAERVTLVWHLAMIRARKTVEALLPTDPKAQLGFDPSKILRG